jgi:hypothetical protein
VKPVLQALVLAEHVYQDVTGKKVIAGTFNRVRFTRKPLIREVEQPDGTKTTVVPGGMHGGSPYAYISLIDVCKGTKLLLQFVNLTKNAVVFGTELTVDCDDRLQTIEIVIPLPPLPIQESGVYAFEVVCEGEILGSYRITAEELKLE